MHTYTPTHTLIYIAVLPSLQKSIAVTSNGVTPATARRIISVLILFYDPHPSPPLPFFFSFYTPFLCLLLSYFSFWIFYQSSPSRHFLPTFLSRLQRSNHYTLYVAAPQGIAEVSLSVQTQARLQWAVDKAASQVWPSLALGQDYHIFCMNKRVLIKQLRFQGITY